MWKPQVLSLFFPDLDFVVVVVGEGRGRKRRVWSRITWEIVIALYSDYNIGRISLIVKILFMQL